MNLTSSEYMYIYLYSFQSIGSEYCPGVVCCVKECTHDMAVLAQDDTDVAADLADLGRTPGLQR